jgi:hypothetical protein
MGGKIFERLLGNLDKAASSIPEIFSTYYQTLLTILLAGDWFAKENNISYRMILQKDGMGEMDVGGISFILRYKADAKTISFYIEPDILVSEYTLSADRMTLLIQDLFGSGVDVHFSRTK